MGGHLRRPTVTHEEAGINARLNFIWSTDERKIEKKKTFPVNKSTSGLLMASLRFVSWVNKEEQSSD